MNKTDYLKYLISEFNLPENTDKHSLLGFFSEFMPSGEGLEKVFSPLNNGNLYLNRLMKMYYRDSQIQTNFDIYQNESYLINIGKNHLSNLNELALLIGNKKLIEYLQSIKDIEIDNQEKHDFNTPEFDIIYHVILDWIVKILNFESPIRILDEAYYSISNDPWLANYFKWPQFENLNLIDAFEPYFQLWINGFTCHYVKNKLIISTLK